jgi:hypothetical protein
MQKYVNLLSVDPGFGFVGLLKTQSRKVISISPSLLEKLPKIVRAQCVEETVEMMEEVKCFFINSRLFDPILVQKSVGFLKMP